MKLNIGKKYKFANYSKKINKEKSIFDMEFTDIETISLGYLVSYDDVTATFKMENDEIIFIPLTHILLEESQKEKTYWPTMNITN